MHSVLMSNKVVPTSRGSFQLPSALCPGQSCTDRAKGGMEGERTACCALLSPPLELASQLPVLPQSLLPRQPPKSPLRTTQP